jgi:hypothetical protein
MEAEEAPASPSPRPSRRASRPPASPSPRWPACARARAGEAGSGARRGRRRGRTACQRRRRRPRWRSSASRGGRRRRGPRRRACSALRAGEHAARSAGAFAPAADLGSFAGASTPAGARSAARRRLPSTRVGTGVADAWTVEEARGQSHGEQRSSAALLPVEAEARQRDLEAGRELLRQDLHAAAGLSSSTGTSTPAGTRAAPRGRP